MLARHSVTVSWNSMGVRKIEVSVTTEHCTAYHYKHVFISDSPVFCVESLAVEQDSGQPSTQEKMRKSYDNGALQVFPNPFQNELTIHYLVNDPGNIKLSIQDMNGRTMDILSETWQDTGQYEVQWNRTEKLVPGIYFVQLETENGIQNKRIVFTR